MKEKKKKKRRQVAAAKLLAVYAYLAHSKECLHKSVIRVLFG
jgi:hypothetical protein